MRTASGAAPLEKRLDGAGWGVLFIWAGIALATGIGWGAALAGIGLITLGVQAARKLMGFALDGFSVTVGCLFVAGGIWQFVNGSVGIVPLLCIGFGVVLLVSAVAGRPRHARRGSASDPNASHGPA